MQEQIENTQAHKQLIKIQRRRTVHKRLPGVPRNASFCSEQQRQCSTARDVKTSKKQNRQHSQRNDAQKSLSKLDTKGSQPRLRVHGP